MPVLPAFSRIARSLIVLSLRAKRFGVCVSSLVLAVILGGCGTGGSAQDAGPTGSSSRTTDASPSSSKVSSTTDPTGRPAVGECRDLPVAALQADDNDSPIVDCTSDHTAETVLVGDLADVGAGSASSAADAAKRVREVGCEQALNDYIGTPDWTATRIRWIAFVPSATQWAAGARWYRCDLDLLPPDVSARTTDTVRVSLHGGWTSELFASIHKCIYFASDDPADNRVVPCGYLHDAEAVPGVIDVPGDFDTPYPGASALADQAGQLCPGAVSDYIGGMPEGVEAVYFAPDEDGWPSSHNVVCAIVGSDGRLVDSLKDHGSGPVAFTPFD